MRLIKLIKKGNVSSGVATIGNAIIATAKLVVASISGNSTMFATGMHSLADTVNQGFVFLGSVLSEMKPSSKFPTGFGRVINIFCMVAVIVVTVMAYETIKSGWESFRHPKMSGDFWLNLIILVGAIVIDGYTLIKSMKEITREANQENNGNWFTSAFKNASRASPATRLVFYEDLVATTGSALAVLGIVLGQYFGILKADGLISMVIGLLMLFVAFRVGYDNMIGLIGVSAPAEVEDKIAKLLLEEKSVVDIYQMRVVQEGRSYHVEGTVELQKGLELAEADDIKFQLTDKLLQSPEVADVVLGIIEDNGEQS